MATEEYKNNLRESHLGQVPWNKGKKDVYSEEAKISMGAPKKGKTYEERYGANKASIMKFKQKTAKLGKPSPKRGKKYPKTSQQKGVKTPTT